MNMSIAVFAAAMVHAAGDRDDEKDDLLLLQKHRGLKSDAKCEVKRPLGGS